MTESIKITIPAAVALFVRPGTTLETRLRGAGGQPDLPPREQVLLLFCLGRDADPQVRDLAGVTLARLGPELVCVAIAEGGLHPAVLQSLAMLYGKIPSVKEGLLALPDLAETTRAVLVAQVAGLPGAVRATPADAEPGPPDAAQDGLEAANGPAADADTAVEEDGEEYLSKYSLAQAMGIGEKIKMALTGDKEWRKILVKDANKLVSSGVIKNPRITEAEVLTIIKSCSPNDEVMRLICANKEWVKNYPIRRALIENPKTPLPNALRYLGTMNEKDLASYAKSRNISSVIATQARRMLLNKKK